MIKINSATKCRGYKNYIVTDKNADSNRKK
jgi:hypothetical protein